MPIYLKHPRHGTKVALCDMEAKADEKNGWERYDITVTAVPIVAQESQLAPVSNTLRVKRPYNRKAA